MITITFVNPKGGTGKTTSCLILAEQLAEAGYKVGVLDCDPNRNILGWQEQRQRKAATQLFDVIAGPSEDDLIDKLAELESIYEVLLLDMEGTADQIVTFALSQTDLCIIPFEPTPMETRQAARSVSLVSRTSKMINRPIKFVLVMTRTNAAFQTSDEKDVRSSIRDMPILDTSLVKRAAFTRIFRDAELLKELDPGSVSNVAKAIENARLFANDVIKHLREENPRMTDYGFGSDGVPKVELKSTRKPVEPDKIQRAVEEGEELGFVPRSPSKKTTKRQSSDTTPVTTSGRRRKKTEPQGKILITGPERVMQRFRDLCDDRDLPYWKVLEELLSE